MQYNAATTQEYIDQLPEERKGPITKIKQILSDNLPEGFQEGIGYKMIAFFVPFSTYPNGYHCLLYTSPSPRDQRGSRMPSSA